MGFPLDLTVDDVQLYCLWSKTGHRLVDVLSHATIQVSFSGLPFINILCLIS